MSASNNTIFRGSTVQKYIQGRDKTILPRFVAPPTFLLLWCLLIIFTCAWLIAWLGQIPMYATGVGVVLTPPTSADNTNDRAVAIVFVPYTSSLHLQVGQQAHVQLGTAASQITGTIEHIDTQLLSPSAIRQSYALVMPAPSLAVMVALDPHLSGHLYAGTPVQAQIQVGSSRLLSFFPGFAILLKEI